MTDTNDDLLALLNARCSQQTGAWGAAQARLGRHVNDFELIHKSRDEIERLRALTNPQLPNADDVHSWFRATGFGHPGVTVIRQVLDAAREVATDQADDTTEGGR